MVESAALLVDDILPEQPIRQWVLSFPFPLRFLLASRPEMMSKVLGVVYRTVSTHLIKKAGQTKKTAQTGAVTLIQRFGSALNLNLHFHSLFLDGVFIESGTATPKFKRTQAPTGSELNKLTHTLSHRIARLLERHGFLQRDCVDSYLELDSDLDHCMDHLLGHSITYRIAIGPNQGRKVFTLQTIPPQSEECSSGQAGNVAGFSLHAGVLAQAHERDKLERLCRYIARPAVSEKRLSLMNHGQVRYQLKTPYRNGTTHVVFEPLDFIAKLAALVPKPKVNLTRFHGVFASRNKLRALVTPGKRLKPLAKQSHDEATSPVTRRNAMTWAQRLKRVFNIDMETCVHCGGKIKVIACVEDPVVIKKILTHLEDSFEDRSGSVNGDPRAPPYLI